MSGIAAWFHTDGRASPTRLVMIGAFVGALVVLGTTTIFRWPVRGLGISSTGQAAEAAFEAPVGSCLKWTRADGGDMATLPCAEPHLFEVSGLVDVSTAFAKDAPFPDQAKWQTVVLSKCGPASTRYLGGKLNPTGRYGVGALKPPQERWKSGDRTLHCGVQSTGTSGGLLPTTGGAAGQDQSNVHQPGTCMGLNDKTVGDPVDCSKQHSFEIIGVIDLGPQSPDGYPSEAKQDELMTGLCTKLANDYSGGANLAANGLVLIWDTVSQESWLAGSHKADCKVGAKLLDGAVLAPVTGSIKGQATPTQEAPQESAPTATPNG